MCPVTHLQLCCLPVWQVADEWCLTELNERWLTLNTAVNKDLTLTTIHIDGVGGTLQGGQQVRQTLTQVMAFCTRTEAAETVSVGS